MNNDIFRLNGALPHDPAIDAWLRRHEGSLGTIAHHLFQLMRNCGDEVRELIHDGCPTVCLGDAAFAYVAVFKSHVNIGFFHGAFLHDPARLLQGTGKRMRHVKLTADVKVDSEAMTQLISAAWLDIKSRVEND